MGNQITLADIVVVSTLLYPMKLVCDKNYLKPFTNVVRWFQTCVNQPATVPWLNSILTPERGVFASSLTDPVIAPLSLSTKLFCVKFTYHLRYIYV